MRTVNAPAQVQKPKSPAKVETKPDVVTREWQLKCEFVTAELKLCQEANEGKIQEISELRREVNNLQRKVSEQTDERMSNDQKMKRLEDMLRTKYGSDTYETVLREEF